MAYVDHSFLILVKHEVSHRHWCRDLDKSMFCVLRVARWKDRADMKIPEIVCPSICCQTSSKFQNKFAAPEMRIGTGPFLDPSWFKQAVDGPTCQHQNTKKASLTLRLTCRHQVEYLCRHMSGNHVIYDMWCSSMMCVLGYAFSLGAAFFWAKCLRWKLKGSLS